MNKKKDEKKKAETTCGTTSSQGESQSTGSSSGNGCCISGLNGSKDSIANDYIKELLKSVEIKDCNCCNSTETTYMQDFVTKSKDSLKESGKVLIKEIEKILLNDNENIIEDVKLLKGYTHQVLWFLLSYVAVEEYILICTWLCRLKEYLCKILECVKNQDSTQSTQCCGHLNNTQDDDCICRILYEIICLLVKSIKRLHNHKREIILRKDTTTPVDCKCKCECCQKDGANGKCTCVENVKKKEDESFTVSTKSLDNIRSTILIFYGMEKIIKKYEKLGCKDGKCKCEDKSENYTECLSLLSVCYNILVDLSSMKDGTLPMAVTWLSNCLMFAGENDKSSLSLDNEYSCRQSKYKSDSDCNNSKVDELVKKYNAMIEKAEELSGVTDNINSGTNCTGTLQSCGSSTGDSGTCGSGETGKECSCNDDCGCQNSASSTTEDKNVFKSLCEMMCCNQEGGSNGCGCSSNSGKCQSIRSFCKEVDGFIKLVNSVIKPNGASQESTSPTTQCECKNSNCDYCKTRRFIRLVEVYTEKLKEVHKCKCNKPDWGDAVIDITLDVGFALARTTKVALDMFGLSSKNGNTENGQGTKQTTQGSKLKFYECKCCIDKKEGNCLKDGKYMMYAVYSRPQVEPGSDLRELEGELNKGAVCRTKRV